MKAAPNRYHCNSSHVLDDMLKALRTMAFPALTRMASKISQATPLPTAALARSTARASAKSGCIPFPPVSRALVALDRPAKKLHRPLQGSCCGAWACVNHDVAAEDHSRRVRASGSAMRATCSAIGATDKGCNSAEWSSGSPKGCHWPPLKTSTAENPAL